MHIHFFTETIEYLFNSFCEEVHAVISLLLHTAGNSGDISYCLLRCCFTTSFSAYLFTVPINLVFVKLWLIDNGCGLEQSFWRGC